MEKKEDKGFVQVLRRLYRLGSCRTLIRSRGMLTYKLALSAILVALTIILTRIGAIMLQGGQLRVGLTWMPIILVGLLLGPYYGLLAGGVSDLLGVLINIQSGSFHILLTLNVCLVGLFAGLIQMAFARVTAGTSLLATVAVTVINGAFIQTIGIAQIFGNPYWVQFWRRLPGVLASGLAQYLAIIVLLPIIEQVLPRSRSIPAVK